ncbi:YibE/F family protein [Vallitalea guaymasensis]|uniref:YibE/F family protein n=1 Tax=Vallitalea guaymasensis TaxID=1185412 RepID=A0A8J8M872_9FIRM|nr:YibE/F family protein [Vallitalea guaymasensis]QUH27980.1 YibE/F family protein [Vallitalea guaymasensis]
MSVIAVLLIILFLLMYVVGRDRGVRSFFTVCFNFLIFFIMVILIANKLNPLIVTIVICIVISSITLFYINGLNKKTISSLISVTIVVLFTTLITYKMGMGAKIQGFGKEQYDSISSLSLYIKLNFSTIVICEILIGLLGAVIDVSISISSSMNELYNTNSSITKKSLFDSGMNIGKDILGTMTNTLFFAYISGFMALIIYFSSLHYSIADILNNKVFCAEVFQILCSGVGIILIIPVTALITSQILCNDK